MLLRHLLKAYTSPHFPYHSSLFDAQTSLLSQNLLGNFNPHPYSPITTNTNSTANKPSSPSQARNHAIRSLLVGLALAGILSIQALETSIYIFCSVVKSVLLLYATIETSRFLYLWFISTPAFNIDGPTISALVPKDVNAGFEVGKVNEQRKDFEMWEGNEHRRFEEQGKGFETWEGRGKYENENLNGKKRREMRRRGRFVGAFVDDRWSEAL